MNLPNDVVGEEIPASIGPLETTFIIQSYEPVFTTVTYKPNRVEVRARTGDSNRTESVLGPVEFTVTVGKWRELNRTLTTGNQQNGGDVGE